MTALRCDATLTLTDVNNFQLRLRAFLDEYDVPNRADDILTVVELPGGEAHFTNIHVGLHLEARAVARDGLETLRGIIEHYVSLFAGDPEECRRADEGLTSRASGTQGRLRVRGQSRRILSGSFSGHTTRSA